MSVKYHDNIVAGTPELATVVEAGNGKPVTSGAVKSAIDPLTANKLDTQVYIPEDGTMYTAPSDGYLQVHSGSASGDFYRVDVYSSTGTTPRFVTLVRYAGGYQYNSVFVKKGMKIKFAEKNSGNTTGDARFYALIN